MARSTDQGWSRLLRTLERHLRKNRVNDWVHGVRGQLPGKDVLTSDPLYESERLRIIYQLITNPEIEGGAGITPATGEWEHVESIFALHDNDYNKDWIKRWSKKYLLTAEDLDEIRDRLGEQVSST